MSIRISIPMKRPTLSTLWREGGRITVQRRPFKEVYDKIPGKSAAEKARRVGVSKQIMSLWKRGKTRPSWQNAQRLAKITGIPANEIYGQIIQHE